MRRNDRYFVAFVNELVEKKQAQYSYIIDTVDYDVEVKAVLVENYALLTIEENDTFSPIHEHNKFKTFVAINANNNLETQTLIADAIKEVVKHF